MVVPVVMKRRSRCEFFLFLSTSKYNITQTFFSHERSFFAFMIRANNQIDADFCDLSFDIGQTIKNTSIKILNIFILFPSNGLVFVSVTEEYSKFLCIKKTLINTATDYYHWLRYIIIIFHTYRKNIIYSVF
jgi:hypothetical protein